jgi:LysR family cyn operon transcriptional activator
VAADHALAKRGQLRMRDLAHEPLALLAPKYCTRQLIDPAFAQPRMKPAVRVEMNSVASILSTVRRIKRVSLLPSLALCERDKDLKALVLTHPTPRRAIGLLWLQSADRRAAATAFARVTETILAERRLNGR